MKLTITIEDEQGAQTLVERSDAGRPAEIPAAAAGEVEATSAGGPPGWLVEQLHEGESQPVAAGADDALDAGAAKAVGDGFVAIPG